MLSGFLKKLLFARQFLMNEGRIEVLGKPQIMFPAGVLVSLQTADSKKFYSVVKKQISSDLEYYGKKLGAGSSGMLKSMADIFETFGLGKVEIVNLDNKKKCANVRIKNVPFALECKNMKIKNCALHNAAIAGMFSYIFNKDVDSTTKECMLKNKKFCEFEVK